MERPYAATAQGHHFPDPHAGRAGGRHDSRDPLADGPAQKKKRTVPQARMISIGDRKFLIVGAGHLVPIANQEAAGASSPAPAAAAAPPPNQPDIQPTFLPSVPQPAPAPPAGRDPAEQWHFEPPRTEPQNPFCPQRPSQRPFYGPTDAGSALPTVFPLPLSVNVPPNSAPFLPSPSPAPPPAAAPGAPASVVVISRKALIRAAAGGDGGAAAVAAALASGRCARDSPGAPSPALPGSPAPRPAPTTPEPPAPPAPTKRARPAPLEAGDEAGTPDSPALRTPEPPAPRTPELAAQPPEAWPPEGAPARQASGKQQRKGRERRPAARPARPAALLAPLRPAAAAFSPVPPSSSSSPSRRSAALQRSPTPEFPAPALAAPAPAASSAPPAVPSEPGRLAIEEVQMVQTLLEGCLQRYMTREEAAAHLAAAHRVDPPVTELVWEKLEQQNGAFFLTYRLWLRIREQIAAFNDLCQRLVSASERAAAARAARAAAQRAARRPSRRPSPPSSRGPPRPPGGAPGALVSPFTAPVSHLPRALSDPLPSPSGLDAASRMELLLLPHQHQLARTASAPAPARAPPPRASHSGPASGSHAATPEPVAGPGPPEEPGALPDPDPDPEAGAGWSCLRGGGRGQQPGALLERVAAALRRRPDRAPPSRGRHPRGPLDDFLAAEGVLASFLGPPGGDCCERVDLLLGATPGGRRAGSRGEPGEPEAAGAGKLEAIDFERIFSFDSDFASPAP
eukprot:tig00021127_g18780.t1